MRTKAADRTSKNAAPFHPRGLLGDQRGSMSIVAFCTLGFVIIGSIFLFYFFTAFIEKRQAQNIADAASLAAARQLRDDFEKAMQDKADQVLQEFNGMIDQLIAAESDSDEGSGEPADGSGGPPAEDGSAPEAKEPPVPGTPEYKDLLARFIKSRELLDKLAAGTYDSAKDWLLVVKEPYFHGKFSAQANGDLLYDIFNRHAGDISYAARLAIEQNHGKPEGSLTFPDDGKPKFVLEAARTMKIDKVGLERDIKARSAAGVSSKDFDIDVGSKPPRTISW